MLSRFGPPRSAATKEAIMATKKSTTKKRATRKSAKPRRKK